MVSRPGAATDTTPAALERIMESLYFMIKEGGVYDTPSIREAAAVIAALGVERSKLLQRINYLQDN